MAQRSLADLFWMGLPEQFLRGVGEKHSQAAQAGGNSLLGRRRVPQPRVPSREAAAVRVRATRDMSVLHHHRRRVLLVPTAWTFVAAGLMAAAASSDQQQQAVIGRAQQMRADSLRRAWPRVPHFLVLAPDDDGLPYALKKVLPAVLVAVAKTQLDVVVHYYDTKCSSSNGPLSVFDYYISGRVDVFFGPSCPYVLAPVIRYASEWGLPLLTAAGQNEHFDTKSVYYRLLTRMNGSFSGLGQVFVEVMRQFDWTVVALLFHQYRDNSKGHTDCYFSLSSVFSALGKNATHHSFDENEDFADIRLLLAKISQKARSEFPLSLGRVGRRDG
ncbi:hypothetical protein HPB48_012784 [Haemaphysalis longicornis]|uniref:Receptor ligand binding region domain-containing protein n=1 Tax=Haemaphysalis longicornis TaxID=44386 RepID=A0A9J6G2X6_HAELO|nr:hypothetical protein HPB48_012784 [Haemaphysalis longicornis]